MIGILFIIYLNVLCVLSQTSLPACHVRMCALFRDQVNPELLKRSSGWKTAGTVRGGDCEASCNNPQRVLKCFFTLDKRIRSEEIQRGIWVCEKDVTVKKEEKVG